MAWGAVMRPMLFIPVNLDKCPDVALNIIFWSHIAAFLKNNGYICIMIDLRTEEKNNLPVHFSSVLFMMVLIPKI